ncbi:MAG: rhomboid family intramembrane serine protease [Saprospiraceae bacterium]|nr:rhomboid family intramembrane serine protease [Saprospiraceae bacterium]
MFRITDVVRHLLIINVMVFIAAELLSPSLEILALRYPLSTEFYPFQLVTHFFMHAPLPQIFHIFFNMFALVMFGSALESLWGPKRFLFYYFVCAFGAAGLHLLSSYWDIAYLQSAMEAFQNNPNYSTYWAYFNEVPLERLTKAGQNQIAQLGTAIEMSPSTRNIGEALGAMNDYINIKMNGQIVGASGAIYGLLLAFGMQFPNAELMLIFLPIPIKAKYFIPILMIIELFLGFNQYAWDNIAHFAHLGGAITGFFLILFWRKRGAGFQ